MCASTFPTTALPRPRFFRITDSITWPLIDEGQVDWMTVWIDGIGCCGLGSPSLPRVIAEECRYRPRLVLRAIRRIQAAAAWCRRRKEGREREAMEILRQQRKWIEALEVEAAMRSLGG